MTRTGRGLELLAEARSGFEQLRKDPGSRSVEEIQALRSKSRSAMDWLEDTPKFESAHQLLDEIGAFVRRVRAEACELPFEDGVYYQECPIKLAHRRVGLSPTFVIRESECSVCREDPWECDHVFGEEYDGQVAHQVITRAEGIEVSLVSRPRQPDARITRMSMSNEELAEGLGSDFSPGVRVFCDRCLSDCEGVSDTYDEDMERLAERESGAPE